MSARPRLLALTAIALASLGGIVRADGEPPVRLAAGIASDCSLAGKKLYGRVKVVDAFPDFEVKSVTSFPDLRVKTVGSFPDACGRWQLVDAFPDFTIELVDAFPGVPWSGSAARAIDLAIRGPKTGQPPSP